MAASEQPDRSRIPYVAASQLRHGGDWSPALLGNLSRHGLFLRLDETPSGEPEVRFPLPDGGPPVTARAAVRWTRHDGGDAPFAVRCGMRLVELATEDLDRLVRVVDRYRERPAPLVGVDQPRSGLVRVPWIVPCVFADALGEVAGTTCNLGVFGVYAALARRPAAGSAGTLRLELPAPIGRRERRVTVTWRNPESRHRPHTLPDGCGFCFEDLSRSDLRSLSRWIDGYLAHLRRGRD